MTHTLTFISLAALGAYAMEVPRLDLPPRPVRIMIELDRSAPHLIWDIVNTGYQPVTLTKLIVHAGNGANDDTLPLGLPETLCYHERIGVAIDVDWALLSARSIVAVDDAGIEYRAPDRQLDVVQDHLRQLIDRRVYSGRGSPRVFLFGVLGRGFFMLMWVIGTG